MLELLLVLSLDCSVDCETMLDLSTLGRELRTRRRALRIPSAELARRIGVSPTYVWLIEQSKPRKSGEPSRPSEDLLRRWMAALGMDASEAQQIREFAGYFGPDFPNERDITQGQSPRTSLRSPSESGPALTPDDVARELGQGGDPRRYGRAAHKAAIDRWAGTIEDEMGDTAIAQRLQAVLLQADRNGQAAETRALLNSFLAWLEFHVGQEL
jgi:transcriptional regulator with XRE-family HTH domain